MNVKHQIMVDAKVKQIVITVMGITIVSVLWGNLEMEQRVEQDASLSSHMIEMDI